MDVNFDVNKVINDIAEGLGVAAEKVYPVLYKQAIITGITDLVWAVLFATLVSAYVVFSVKRFKFVQKNITEQNRSSIGIISKSWDDYLGSMVLMILGGIVSVILVMVGVACITEAITALLNTEYYIVEDVMKKIRG